MQPELKPFGIQVQTINPGAYLTGFNESMAENAFRWLDDEVNFASRGRSGNGGRAYRKPHANDGGGHSTIRGEVQKPTPPPCRGRGEDSSEGDV